MYENLESMTPDAGNTIPSRRKRGYSRGANIDSELRKLDREDILRKVATYPQKERKMQLRLLMKQYRERR